MFYICTSIWIIAGLLAALPLLGIIDALGDIFANGDFGRFGQIIFTIAIAVPVCFGAYYAAENWFRD